MAKTSRLLEVIASEQREPIPLVERRTDELVIGMVGPVASGVTFSASLIASKLKDNFGYDGEIVKVSEFINISAYKVGETAVDSKDENRIKKLQLIGSRLRERYGANYLAEKCVEHINQGRGDLTKPAIPRRQFTILDSLKNPDEVHLLQDVYGDNFWLFGIFAPEPIRKSRLSAFNFDAVYVEEIIHRDQDEGVEHGQQVRETMHLSDFFIRNDAQNTDRLGVTIDRFFDIIFGTGVRTPTFDEQAMFAAASAAAGSACLSRQVGAVIMTPSGSIIGHGTNDVPKYGGGLYSTADDEKDHRCFKWRLGVCHNDDRKKRLFDQSLIALIKHGVIKSGHEAKASEALKETGIKNLVEFSRSIHAEMDAIISVARSGRSGIVGASLFSTTFPCHGCARHIVASGIERVIYIEPYTKSLALDLHQDAISIDEYDKTKVRFLQYEGVAPKNAVKLFKDRGDRKKAGKISLVPKHEAHPATRGPLDGLQTREEIIVVELRQRESKASASK